MSGFERLFDWLVITIQFYEQAKMDFFKNLSENVIAKQGLAYLYTRKTLPWNEPDFAIYATLFASVQVLGRLI